LGDTCALVDALVITKDGTGLVGCRRRAGAGRTVLGRDGILSLLATVDGRGRETARVRESAATEVAIIGTFAVLVGTEGAIDDRNTRFGIRASLDKLRSSAGRALVNTVGDKIALGWVLN